MKTKHYLLLALGLWCLGSPNARADRREFLLEKGWRFTRTDDSTAVRTDYDDSRWQRVTVPHDWAIYGPFNPNNDRQNVAIVQDGQVEPSEHAGRTGGLPFVGAGWYRTRFDVPEFGAKQDKRVTLQFDGAMSGAQVWVNGKKAGEWPYGYNSFYFDVTPYLNADGMNNTVAVRLENLPESSRWYPGAGLYRNVHVVVTDGAHIPVWGTYVTTPEVNDRFAKVNLKTEVVLPEGFEPNRYRLATEILDSAGRVVTGATSKLSEYDGGVFVQDFVVDNPALWDLENPVLYTAVSKLYEGNDLKDEYSTPFGIRTIEVRPDDGFYLNGRKTVFKGVCNHHDLGPLGAAVNEAAIRRQVRMLKDMGANAIRTSHNMPAPELVRACNEMGMMLMVETFDEWRSPKCQNGYNRLFDAWAEKDLVNVIRHYRNAPSVVMWCIGNEVPEQGMEHGAKIAHWLQSIAHREDPTRPVTQGMDNPGAVINNNFAAVMEVPGFNYRPFMYPENYRKLPQRIILGTETASTVSSRGVYKFPVVRAAMKTYPDHQASSYDVEHCGWSNLPEDDFIQHEDLPYAFGEFVWTGFDYLGEPTPYYTNWPSHSSLFGIIDLAGIPKDRYYLYRSHWNPSAETLHILPHWTWPEERIGDTIPVFVYTNYPSAELFINGVSQGIRTKDTTIKVEGSYTKEAQASFERQKRYRLMWMDTKYEPGTVRVVAYDSTGRAVATEEIHTAGKPYRIELTADRTVLDATGRDLSFINVRVVDRDGNLCPDDTREIKFKVKGAGSYRAAANGNPASLELFHLPQMKLFSGQLTAIVQSAEAPGKIVFEATAPGVRGATLTLQVR
ncbi:glycoside hydrolase family 2 TIM barrel-domain containing protein [uncultured Rikenella sp.]|uniref:glycoside hydrolase family 2 TIM barrel-domain containing protein n=1 Tax=uncultured Rikenella sp. TaxID=368003 RepID=UPI00272BD872|nr:glycoside hydrolase family 2 TIM barrel-domain containing protein [uncultured Rikenella sp.]